MRLFSFAAIARKALICTRIWDCSMGERATSPRQKKSCVRPWSLRPTTPMRKTHWPCLSARMRSGSSRFERSEWEVFLKGDSNSFHLNGKLAVVTGGASGICRAVAHRFARSGACVRVLDIDEDAAKTVAGEIVSSGGEGETSCLGRSRRGAVQSGFHPPGLR